MFTFILLGIASVFGQTTPDTAGQQLLFDNAQSTDQQVNIELFFDDNLMQMTYSGPSTNWYGIGFNNTVMTFTYAIIIDGEGNLQERQLGMNSPGMILPTTVEKLNDNVSNGVRTVKLSRPMIGNNSDYFTFTDEKIQNFSIIYAYGNTPTVAYHQNRSWDTFYLTPPTYRIQHEE